MGRNKHYAEGDMGEREDEEEDMIPSDESEMVAVLHEIMEDGINYYSDMSLGGTHGQRQYFKGMINALNITLKEINQLGPAKGLMRIKKIHRKQVHDRIKHRKTENLPFDAGLIDGFDEAAHRIIEMTYPLYVGAGYSKGFQKEMMAETSEGKSLKKTYQEALKILKDHNWKVYENNYTSDAVYSDLIESHTWAIEYDGEIDKKENNDKAFRERASKILEDGGWEVVWDWNMAGQGFIEWHFFSETKKSHLAESFEAEGCPLCGKIKPHCENICDKYGRSVKCKCGIQGWSGCAYCEQVTCEPHTLSTGDTPWAETICPDCANVEWEAESFKTEDCKNVKAFVEYTCVKCDADRGLYEVKDGNFYRFNPDLRDCGCGGFEVNSNEFITCQDCDDTFWHRYAGWSEHLRIIMNRKDTESFESDRYIKEKPNCKCGAKLEWDNVRKAWYCIVCPFNTYSAEWGAESNKMKAAILRGIQAAIQEEYATFESKADIAGTVNMILRELGQLKGDEKIEMIDVAAGPAIRIDPYDVVAAMAKAANQMDDLNKESVVCWDLPDRFLNSATKRLGWGLQSVFGIHALSAKVDGKPTWRVSGYPQAIETWFMLYNSLRINLEKEMKGIKKAKAEQFYQAFTMHIRENDNVAKMIEGNADHKEKARELSKDCFPVAEVTKFIPVDVKIDERAKRVSKKIEPFGAEENLTELDYIKYAKKNPKMANRLDTDDMLVFFLGVAVGTVGTFIGNIWSHKYIKQMESPIKKD